MTLMVGDRVRKTGSYKWPGIVVARFQTLAGETRVVVECTAPEVEGALHIFNPDQLEKALG
jgi:hypothetical protein